LTDGEIQLLKWCQAVHFHVVENWSQRDSYKTAGVSASGFKTSVISFHFHIIGIIHLSILVPWRSTWQLVT
jgi:hypothetical protein